MWPSDRLVPVLAFSDLSERLCRVGGRAVEAGLDVEWRQRRMHVQAVIFAIALRLHLLKIPKAIVRHPEACAAERPHVAIRTRIAAYQHAKGGAGVADAVQQPQPF